MTETTPPMPRDISPDRAPDATARRRHPDATAPSPTPPSPAALRDAAQPGTPPTPAAPRAAPLDRRRFILAASAGGALGAGWIASPFPAAAQDTTQAQDDPPPPAAPVFGFETVLQAARDRARESHQNRRQTLSGVFSDLDYDAYRAIRYREDRRIWRGEGLGFEIDLMPPGAIYRDVVDIAVVEDGAVRPLPFDPSALHFDEARFGLPDGRAPEGAAEGHAWTGFRLRYPINRPEMHDEISVFQGASFFRGIGRDQIFGLSARALAINTGAPGGEEFPVFTRFWLHRPSRNATEFKLHALLESQSVVGAYEFLVRPGAETVVDVRSTLIPRVELTQVGIAPLTSMYFFGAKERGRVDDYRDAVHDSMGLQMLTGHGERLWRPLANPATLQLSAFQDVNPRGYGLVQRRRAFEDYQDAEARYEKRPSAWVTPLDEWGEGDTMLVEIPTDSEFNDNIVSFWRPRGALAAEREHPFAYRLYWCALPPDEAPSARVRETRAGRSVNEGERRLLVVDFDIGERPIGALRARAETSAGRIMHLNLRSLPRTGVARVVIGFNPPDAGGAEFRLQLVKAEGGEPVSETWLYRWTPA